ncbi:MAG: hypothetical protein HC800_04920 [Phormidesmis sp. RL_2_1]|nr:hypothetical protein [Phormidesmis sp. RL_2_1]
MSALSITSGYQDPTDSDSDFAAWSTPTGTTSGQKRVLVDFVDSTTTVHNQPPLNNACASFGASYRLVPNNTPTSTSNTSFFGCVRDPSPGIADIEGNGNQDAYIFLRGSTKGAGNSLGPVSDKSALPTLEGRILMRGVINKNPID